MPSRCLRSLVLAYSHRCLGDDCTWTTPHPNHTTRIHMHAYTQTPTNINRATPQTVLSIGLLPSLPKTYIQRRKHVHVLALLPCSRITAPPASIAAPRSCVLLVEWSEMGIGTLTLTTNGPWMLNTSASIQAACRQRAGTVKLWWRTDQNQ
jgi:hypothetical protein